MSGKKRKKAASRAARPERVRVLLDALEIARGHDGLLRGAPDPVLVTAVYAARAGDSAALLTRSFRRLRPESPFPSECGLRGEDRTLATAVVPTGSEHILVLVAAIEENDAREVEEVYAELSDTDALSLWRESDALPEPLLLAVAARRLALAVAATQPEGARVELLHAGAAIHTRLRPGAWIGTAAVALAREGERPSCTWRLRFTNTDGANDWTARVDISW